MIKYSNKQILKYNNILNLLKYFGIITVISEPETGKTFISEEFIQTLDCQKWMLDNIFGENGLKKLYNQVSQKFKSSFVDNTNFDSEMRKSVISYLVQPKSKVIILDNFESYDSEVLNFWENIINSVRERVKSKCLFIININSISNSYESKLLRNNSLYIHPCNLPSWESEDLKELFYFYYKNNIKIRSTDLDIIIDYSINNPAHLLDNVNALKATDNICYNFDDNLWECKNIDENVLAMRHNEKIKLRYNKLDNNFKIAINKASLVGCNFDCLTMTNIFEIKNANIIFKRIEDISRLIYIENITPSNHYRFISERVRDEIETYIEKKDLNEWRKLLGHYYLLTLNDSNLLKTQKAINLEKAADYFLNSNDFETSIRCKNELIKILVDINCYLEAIFQLESIIDLIKKSKINEHLLSVYFYYLYLYNLKLFRFEESLYYFELYKKIYPTSEKQNYYENIYINGFLHYNMNNTPCAFKILDKAYRDIMKSDKNNDNIDWNNACKILEVFTAICDSVNDKRYINVYNNALHLAKKYKLEERYYTLLRKANIAHKNEPAIKLISEAKNYFQERDANEYAMAMYNIAMEYIYIPDKLDNSFSEISISERIFDEIGSISSKLTGNVFGIYYCFRRKYDTALKEFSRIDSDDSFCSLAAFINSINCYRKLKEYKAEIENITQAEFINSKDINQFHYFEGALLVLKAYALMEKNEVSCDKEAIDLLDQYLMIDTFSDRIEQKLSVRLTAQLLKNKYNIPVPKNQQLDINCINYIVKFLSDERLYFCEILFIE
jgi:hypothetical protein